jgi:hypothetical protein
VDIPVRSALVARNQPFGVENSQKTFRRAQNVTDQRRSVADYLITVTGNVRPAAAINATNG